MMYVKDKTLDIFRKIDQSASTYLPRACEHGIVDFFAT